VWLVGFLAESFAGEVSGDYDERVDLLRRGAGLFAGLCGVFCGFVGLVVVLVLMFFGFVSPLFLFFDQMLVLFASSSFVYLVAALLFVSVSTTSSFDESLNEMTKDYALARAVMILATALFFGGMIPLTYSVGIVYVIIASIVCFVVSFVRFLQLFAGWLTS
jgi:hypothetical protein